MLNVLLMFIPEEAYLAVIIVAGLLIIIGLRTAGFSLVLGIIAILLLGPIVEGLLCILPSWILLILIIVLFITMFRAIVGRGIYDNFMARLLYDLFRLPFRFLGWLLRGLTPRGRV